ncbi:MAG: lysophospholipid acyltransferase family protein [Candidatus Eisenbacteria bacterium]
MPRSRKITVQHRLEYAAGRAAQAAICALPAAWARGVGAALGGFAFSVLRLRRGVVMQHLERVFAGERSHEELVRIARESYRNFGRMTFEYMRFPRMTPQDVEALITVTGGEHIDAALEDGRGAILVAGHFGNWETLAMLACKGYPMTFLVGEQHNILVDGLMNRLRARFGGELVPVTGNLMGVLRALRGNRVVAMLSDQDAGRNGVFVEFLGKPASTPYGPGRMSESTGAPLLPCAIVRRGGGAHEIVVCPPVAFPSSDLPKKERVRVLTQGYTAVFGQFIRQCPDHYFWMHKRWKTRPPEGDGSAAGGNKDGTADEQPRPGRGE